MLEVLIFLAPGLKLKVMADAKQKPSSSNKQKTVRKEDLSEKDMQNEEDFKIFL